jgi:hypothetical protein
MAPPANCSRQSRRLSFCEFSNSQSRHEQVNPQPKQGITVVYARETSNAANAIPKVLIMAPVHARYTSIAGAASTPRIERSILVYVEKCHFHALWC